MCPSKHISAFRVSNECNVIQDLKKVKLKAVQLLFSKSNALCNQQPKVVSTDQLKTQYIIQTLIHLSTKPPNQCVQQCKNNFSVLYDLPEMVMH